MIFPKDHKIRIFIVGIFLVFSAGIANAANNGDVITFNVDKSFDASARDQVISVLVKTTTKLYFYIEKPWWDSQLQAKQNEVLAYFDILSKEFDSKIYPTLTSVFGYEWRPGIDGDDKITVLFESMNSAEGGYFRTTDEYIKLQLPNSNEREMIYLSIDYISDSRLKNIMAHEFMHLITFNQKNKIFGIEDGTWLNEIRADYSSTILGYDTKYESSNFQQRVKDFAERPADSITEWLGTKYDYASASLFNRYLMDHYGIQILIDSLKSKYVGIESINYALKKSGIEDDFAKIFTNWTIANIVNNCEVNRRYCYLSENLKNFRLVPSLNFLPLTGNVSLSVANVTKSWTGNWLKFIGGNGDLKLDFSTLKGLVFQVPYIVEDSAGSYSIKFLALDQEAKGSIEIKKFGSDYKSLIIVPSLQSQIYQSEDIEPTYPFNYTVSVNGSSQTGDSNIIQQLLERIAVLKQEIARLLAQQGGGQNYCSSLDRNLYFGMSNNSDVQCLQNFLKNQSQNIYPEGLITGNFGNLTKQAVIKFQAIYSIPQTGFVGPLTREKINQIMSGG